MASVIKPKRSAVAGNIPTTAQIGQYEIAMNTADKKIFTSDGTNIIQIASGTISGLGDVNITSPANGQSLSYNSSTGKWVNSNAGTGDVVGPASSTDNSVVRFDGTTGKLIQGSPVTISDTGAISGAESISNIDFAQFDTTVTPVEGIAKLQWDDGNGTLQVGLKGGNVNLQIGQEIVARVYNDSGVALTDGQIVYISGSQGNRIAVKLAKADSEATSAGTLGMVTEPIAIGAEGFITMTGTVNKLNTSGLTAGALVYLSATTAGAYTTTAPTAPNHRVTLGYVERVDNVVGSIYVKVDNGYELDELHNVSIVTVASGNTLIYDATAGVWKNASLSSGTGISITNGAGSITIGNTGVTSLTGTANQVTASASTGGVTLSLPATINVNTSGSAATLTTGRTIGMTGDVTWTSASFNGSANVTGTATLASVGTAGTYTKVTTDAKGRVTSGTTLSASDIPDLTLEKIPDAWVKKSVRAATTANITLSGTQTIDGIALVAGDRVLVKDQTTTSQNGIYVVSATAWARSADADTINELAGACVNVDSGTTNGGFRFDTDLKSTDTLGTTAVSFYRVLDLNDTATTNTANKIVIRDGSGNFSAGTITAALTGNASTATTLQTARTINGASFNGSANITTTSWGTARTVTIGSTGKSVDGSANVSWTLAEIGAQAADADLTAIAALVGTSGFLKKTAADTWALDTNTYYLASNPSGYTTNTGTVTSVGGTGTVSGLTLSGTVTTSGNLTLGGTLAVTPSNFASQTANTVLIAPNGTAGVPTFRALVAADIPILNQNTTGTASNVTGTVAIANGGTGSTTSAGARTNLGATTVGSNLFTLTNPSAVTFPRINADNTVSALDAATFRTAIGAGTSSTTGTVTSITAGTGLSGGTITTSGTISLANTTVTAGSYTNANITVDAQGRITSATSGTSGGITISDDTTTNATRYIVFEDITSGTSTTMQVSSSKLTFNPSTGTLTATAVSASSDESLKTNWRQLGDNFIYDLAMVKHGTYDRTDTDIPVTQDGVSAQSLSSVLPHSVIQDENGLLSVNYGNAALVSAIKLAEKVVEQEKRIEELEKLVSKLLEKL